MTKAAETIEGLANSLRSLMNYSTTATGATFTIGELSSHLGVSLRTLRFYEQAGLLLPHREGARRIYSSEDRARLEVIVALREFEVSLTGIKQLLATADAGGPNIETRIVSIYDQLLADVHSANSTRIAELEGINGRVERARLAVSG
jgi:DNA-binding transcriptional MerR regulator